MSTLHAIDEGKLNAFMDKVVGDLSATYVTLMCVLGDRLGLFKDLAANGPATSAELAKRAGVNERYAREWLSGLTSAGYLEYDSAGHRFTLPPEHATALVEEGGPNFVAGVYQAFSGEVKILDRLTQVFRQGGGIPIEEYDENEFAGTERMTATWFESLLVQHWLPTVPDVQAKLERGVQVADVGCGRGRALIKLAKTFPNSRYVGFDPFGPAISRATANAAADGVDDRVSFKQLDVVDGLPGKYDIITTFDVIHDMVNPRGALRAIRRALKPDGTYLLLDFNCKDKLEENMGPVSAMLYGFSIIYCMTVSLANGGEGLGTMGLPESKVRELCAEAGFSKVQPLPIDNPFNTLYEIKP